MKELINKKLLLHIFLICFSLNISSQTSWKGVTSTNWNTASNWSNGLPSATVDVIIGDANFTGAFQPALLAGNPTCKSLTIGTSAKVSSLSIGRNITVSGNITIGANGTILHTTASRTITLKGDWINTGTYTASVPTATVTFSGTAQTIIGTSVFQRIRINAGSTLTLSNNITINDNLFVSGRVDPTQLYTISGTGTLTVNLGGILFVKAADFTTNYNLSGAITLDGRSTVNYASSTINQNVSNALTYGYLRISGGMTKSLTGNLPGLSSTSAAAGRIYIDAGTLDLLTYTADRSAAGGIITIAALAQLKIGGTNTFPNYTTKTIATTSTVEYNGTNQTILATTYGHLSFSSSSGAVVKTMPATAMTIAGNFTSYAGAGTGVTFTAANAITVNKIVSLDAASTFNGATFTHTFRGNWINNGIFTGNTSTVVFNGVSATLSGTGSNNFNNLTFSAAGISASSATSINVSGNLATTGSGIFTHLSGGTLTMTGTTKAITGNGFRLANCIITGTITTAANITVSENFTSNGSFAASAGTITFNGTSKNILGSGNITFYSLNISGSISTANNFTMLANFSVSLIGSFTSTAGIVTFNNSSVLSGRANLYDVTINSAKTLRLGTNSILGIAGTFIKTGTLNVTTSVPNTVEYNSAAAQSIVNTTYNNLTLANGGTKTAAGAITVNNDFTINASVTFGASSYTFTLYRHFINNGTFTASTSTIQFLGANTANINGIASFYNLTVNKNSAAIWVVLLNNITVTNNLTMTRGNMQTNTNAVIVTGTRLGTGAGLILGTITQNHAFNTATAYYFEGPNNILTFTTPVGVNSVTVTTTLGEVTDFDATRECIFRQYAITIPSGTYTNATLRLHYEDNELNAFDEPFLGLYKYNSGVLWDSIGFNSRNVTNNYVEKTFITALAGRWTLSGQRNKVRWNGSVSTDWATAANWTTVSGSNMSNRVPTSTDAVEIGQAAFTNNPTVSTNQTINIIRYGSVQASTLTISSNTLTVLGSIRGIWSASVSHTVDVASGALITGTDLELSDGTAGHNILLKIGNGSATINNDLTQRGNSSINFTGNGTLTVGRDFNYTNGSFTAGTGTVVYTGTTAQLVAPVTYNNLSFTKSTESALINVPTIVNGNLTTSIGGELTISDTLTVGGNITIGALNTFIETGTRINVAGNFTTTGAFTSSTGSINFNGTGNQTVNANTFNTILINKSAGTLSLTGNLTINSDITVNAGTLDLVTYTADRSNPGGTFTLGASATLKLGGSTGFPSNYNNNILSSTSTVEYNGTVAQSVIDIDYGNLIFTNGGATPKTLLGDILINGNLLINTGTTFAPDSYTITLNGNMVHNGVYTPAASTLILTGTSKTISGSSSLTLNNMTIIGGIYTVNNSIVSLTGDFYNDVSPSSIDFGTATITLDGDLTNKGSMKSSGIFNISGTRQQTLSLISALESASTGVVNFNGTVEPILNSTSPPNFYTVNINNTGSSFTTSQPWTVVMACTIAAGANVDFGSNTQTFLGNFTNNGTVQSSGKMVFTSLGGPYPSSGTVTLQAPGASFTNTNEIEFGGTGAITLAGTTPTALSNITITNTNAIGITPPANWVLSQDLYVGSSATFNGGTSFSHSIAGNITNNGILNGGTSTITFNGGTSTIEGIGTSNFNNLTIQTGADVGLNNSINISGNLVNNGAFTTAGRDVSFIGSGASTISGTSPLLFENFIQNKSSSTTTLSVPVTITGDLTLTNGIINTTATNILTLEDNATATAGNINSFIDGPMKKVGDDAFVFPVGNGVVWARIGMSAPTNATSVFQAQYLKSNYANTTSVTAPIHHVSKIEHWVLNRTVGADNVNVTLYWEDGNRSKINDMITLVVARFNGTSWVNETQNGGTTGTVSTGSMTSQTISSFSPFTFGAKLSSTNPLPIELLSFNATKNFNNGVDLNWSTASETSNDFFTIERSKDGDVFEKIMDVKGAGNSTNTLNYKTVDNEPLAGTSYYRLKQTDFDGKYKYSKLVAVTINKQQSFTISPNPLSLGKTNSFKINGISDAKKIKVRITDMQGKLMLEKTFINQHSEELIICPLTGLTPGVYLINLFYNQSDTYTQKLIVY